MARPVPFRGSGAWARPTAISAHTSGVELHGPSSAFPQVLQMRHPVPQEAEPEWAALLEDAWCQPAPLRLHQPGVAASWALRGQEVASVPGPWAWPFQGPDLWSGHSVRLP